MRAHIVENGVIVNTVIVGALDAMPNLVEATQGGIGWLYNNGVFTDPNALTEQELNERKANSVRSKRNALLASSDWIVIMHTEKGTNIPAEWEIYRQSLRDITAQPGFPHDVTWPTKP